MKWIDEVKQGVSEYAKVGIFELAVYTEKGGGWFAVVSCQSRRVGGVQGPYDSTATAKRAAVRSINTIIQAARGDLLEDEAGGKK